MILTGTRAHGATRRRMLGGDRGVPSLHKGEWMESGDDPALSPTVFLVEQPPGSVLPTHFHRNNEFQVVVQGGGMLGRHAVRSVMVHYAGAYSGYGPIAAGDQGLSYFTLRAVCEAGVLTEREEMVRGPKVQHHVPAIDVADAATLRECAQPVCETLLGPDADGLCVQRILLGPGQRCAANDPAGSTGQFHLVLAGTLDAAGQALGLWESAFHSAAGGAPRLVAGPEGADVLVLQIPHRDPVYAGH